MNAATIQSQLEQAVVAERHWKSGGFEISEAPEILMNFETSVLSQVQATRRADGTLQVTKTRAA